ncbi:MAG: cation-translocating P-type ATPase, partial [Clostridiales bacterium]|nr:cation-translocating P-type ATPase [Clostridiales bacterium]
VETLGGANVICSDKTGTLTQNKMKVVEIAGCNGKLNSTDDINTLILKYGTLCNDSKYSSPHECFGDPTELAIVIAAASFGINKESLSLTNERVREMPFDSKRKLMSTIHKNQGGFLVITKGAPDILINKCCHYYDKGKIMPMNQYKKSSLNNINSNMAEKALRVLGVAYKEINVHPSELDENDIESGLTYLGFIGMIDPPREEVYDAVSTCKKAGIKPVMVTGDHVITAKAIAEKLGIIEKGGKAMTGDELNKLSQSELINIINDYSVFARLAPEHKVRIVKAFQSNGDIVAMTGDGVNDAPALKSADIGCAMGLNGTDVAKGASDMILADDNFATIVYAVKEGRGIYSNIKKSTHFLLSSNIGEIITILAAMLIGFETPLLAIHLLWVNLVTDSLPAIALGLEPAEKDVMSHKPFNVQKSLFSDGLWQRVICEGFMVGFLALIAFGIGAVYYDIDNSFGAARTMAFATLSISQLVHAFNMRSDNSIFTINIFDNLYLVFAFFIGSLMQAAVITIKPLSVIFKVETLSLEQWLIVIILCLMPLFIVELEKLFGQGRDIENKTNIFANKGKV